MTWFGQSEMITARNQPSLFTPGNDRDIAGTNRDILTGGEGQAPGHSGTPPLKGGGPLSRCLGVWNVPVPMSRSSSVRKSQRRKSARPRRRLPDQGQHQDRVRPMDRRGTALATARRPDQRNCLAPDPARQPDAPQMALEPATVAARHVWEDLEQWAIAKAETALEAVPRAFAPDDKDYLTARAQLMQTIAAGARKKLEAKP